MEIELHHYELGDWTVVTPSGEVDVSSAPALRENLIELVTSGSDRLIIDLDQTDFIDSTGLGVLVGALRRARSAGGDVRLACNNTRILKVFDVTGLHKVFLVAEDVEAAASAPSEVQD